jgi:hypothetical protein
MDVLQLWAGVAGRQPRSRRAEPTVLCCSAAVDGWPYKAPLGRIFTGRGLWDSPERARPATSIVCVKGSSYGWPVRVLLLATAGCRTRFGRESARAVLPNCGWRYRRQARLAHLLRFGRGRRLKNRCRPSAQLRACS